MKKIKLLLASFISISLSFGQATSLDENMNTTCITGVHGPTGWMTYNPIPPNLLGATSWTCGPTYGRDGTPGISCSGQVGSSFQLDTSILTSSGLNLSSYSVVYVNFDTKTNYYNFGSKLELLLSRDSTMDADSSYLDTSTVYNKTASIVPMFSTSDESGWETHQMDLTPYKNVVPLYVAFRYTSAAGTFGSRWYLDNIRTTTIPLPSSSVQGISSYNSRLSVSGSAKEGTLTVHSSAATEGNYDIALYDMAGRQLHRQQMHMNAGPNTFTIQGLNIPQGICLLKTGNESSFASAKIYAW